MVVAVSVIHPPSPRLTVLAAKSEYHTTAPQHNLNHNCATTPLGCAYRHCLINFLAVPKRQTGLVGSSNVNFALIDAQSLSKCSSIVNCNIDTSSVAIGALGAKILLLKAQICIHLQTRALLFWPSQAHEADVY